LAEVEALCDHVTIIRGGRVVETGALSDIRHLTRTSIAAELSNAPVDLSDFPGVRDFHFEDGTLRCLVDTAELGALLKQLDGFGIKSLISQPPTLEELFLRLYADEPSEGGASSERK
jgi:ABC-2 type transport system ATP-binding protein